MKLITTTLTLLILCVSASAQQNDYGRLKNEAEKLYAEHSYAKAYELYKQAGSLKLSPGDTRWVAFRTADTLWRSEAASSTADTTKFDEAREQLDRLVRDIKRPEEKDRVWAEVHESLADFSWSRQSYQNWGEAWPHYQIAFDWWSGQSDLETARQRYLQLLWKTLSPPWMELYNGYYYGNNIPLDILENGLRIAKHENDRARLHFYIGNRFRQGGDWEQRQRVPDEFEAALKPGKTTDWYDDALYFYGEWMQNTGIITQSDTGEWRQEPDYTKALQLFTRLVNEFSKGDTRYYDQAQQQIINLTNPAVGVFASSVFLPESEIQVNISWRNVKRIDFKVYKVDLTRQTKFINKDISAWSWIQQIDIGNAAPVRAWSRDTNDNGTHKPGQDTMRLDGRLPSGAYVITANAGTVTARDVILVTDSTLVLKTVGKQVLVYFCEAITGAPVANANVALWEKTYKQGDWRWQQHLGTTNNDGISTFELDSENNYNELFVSAQQSGRQAFSLGQANYASADDQPWRVFAFTDRPAYRPQETVQWKFLARKLIEAGYSTPANQVIEYEIRDPQGNKVKEAVANLNDFGSAWGSLELTDKMVLGAYQVTFYDQGKNHNIGSANLFRLEEYKLPEFKISVKTPEVDGQKKAFRLGEKVEVTLGADYYFGGPVSDATVEVVVYQNPFYHYWIEPREYSWYYTNLNNRNYWYAGRGQIVKRETLKTDAQGKANLSFDTPRDAGQDWEYVIEARVTDSSRREVVGSDTVRVTRHRYYVYPKPDHTIYRPNDKVEVNIKALDANNNPASVTGQVKVTRDYYYEIWIDESGREIKGQELQRIRDDATARRGQFPPAPSAPGKGWRLKFRGYQHDDVSSQTLKTDASGVAKLEFTPAREGYYRVQWTSPDKGAAMVQAETAVWVSTDKTTELGYRTGGVEIIVDKDTFRAGQTAPVMITTSLPDRYVLFSVETDRLASYQLLRMNGTAKLLNLPIEDKHIPNAFLNAVMVSERQMFIDQKEVIVPPVDHFLTVDVKSDRAQYQPGEEGTLKVTTKDSNGRPVAAEVALGLIDSSVFYIQQDTAGDPRQFYFGTKRQSRSQVQSTFQFKAYSKLVVGQNEQLIDEFVVERERQRQLEDRDGPAAFYSVTRSGTLAFAKRGEARSDVSQDFKSETAAFAGGATPVNGRLNNLYAMDAVKEKDASQEPAVQVRSDFRSTVFWQPDVVTDRNGLATVKVKYPDSLTSWTATARVVTAGDKFGIASDETRTKKPLIVRLQAPRFFVAGDSVTVSAVINNNEDQPLTVTPSLTAEGVVVSAANQNHAGAASFEAPAVTVKGNSEERVDWIVNVPQAGPVKLKVTARGGANTDAMERSYTAYEHGIEKLIAKSGKMRSDEVAVKLDIPAARKPGTTNLTVQVAPSMAVTMLDALPYLIDYPYGCTEQTLSRFLPAVITVKTLKDQGLSPEAAMEKIFGGIEPDTAIATHPKGKRNLSELNEIVRQSLERLYSMQHSDGGWGWWKNDSTDHFMTAYALWGLTLAKEAGVDVREDVLRNAANYLSNELVEEELNYDMQAWELHAIATYKHSLIRGANAAGPGAPERKALENLWTNRDRLNSYTRALFALSAHYFGDAEKSQALVRNLENGVKLDASPDTSILIRGSQSSSDSVMATAHWGNDGIYYRWSDGGVEATSFVLRALLAIDPSNKLIEPVTNWLITNRRGSQWSNTRDTAITILALNDYLRTTGEAVPNLTYDVSVNGNSIVSKQLTAKDALSAPSQFVIDQKFIRDGVNEIRVRRTAGSGPLYFAANARFFSLEEPVKAAGNEIFAKREYFKLVGRPTLLKGFVYDRVPLRDGETVESGERVEAVITVESKNNYEYLLFEDLKPAGLEAVQIRSGESLYARELKSGEANRKFMMASATDQGDAADNPNLYTSRSEFVYQELRDRKVALFISRLLQGVWEIRYSFRAEAPGTFHALPIVGQAMYVPEIRCNDQEIVVKVADRQSDR
jgi:alpha-2-macroglobulin